MPVIALHLILGVLLGARGLGAQETYCFPMDSDSSHTIYLDHVRKLASDPDTAYTATGKALGYPRVPADAVVLVRNESVCRRAAQAFAANVPAQSFRPLSGMVFVVAVGQSHYYVVDPQYLVSPNFTYFVLFTKSWQLVYRHGH